MEQAQREYFVRRLNEIAAEKVQAKAVELFGPTGRPQQPTWGMVFEGIKSGEITLKADKMDYTGPYLNPQDVEWPAMEAKVEALEAYRKTVEAERQKAMDACMLDADAQKALTAFQGI
jgi:lipopolysaccharide export system protein LptA